MSDELVDHLKAVRRKNGLKSEYLFCVTRMDGIPYASANLQKSGFFMGVAW